MTAKHNFLLQHTVARVTIPRLVFLHAAFAISLDIRGTGSAEEAAFAQQRSVHHGIGLPAAAYILYHSGRVSLISMALAAAAIRSGFMEPRIACIFAG